MNKRDSVALIVALSLIFFAAAITGSLQKSGTSKNPPSMNTNMNVPAVPGETPGTKPSSGEVVVESPRIGDLLSSPLTVTGKARRWYFEGSFPVELKDANGKVLAVVPATAQGDWMTEDFVPFSATLVFEAPATPTGTLVLKKDNPSGLSQFDDQMTMSVSFMHYVPTAPAAKPCMPSGCSGQVCSDRDVVTTCEYTPAYSCYQSAKCERQADGQCGWTMSNELRSCLENANNQAVDVPR